MMTTSRSETDTRVEYEMGPLVDGVRYGDKFIQQYTFKELEAAYIEHTGVCRICGSIVTKVGHSQMQELVRFWMADRNLQRDKPELNITFDRMACNLPCTDCATMKSETRRAMAKESAIKKVRARLLHYGIIPQEFHRCRFIDSDEEIMLENAEHWEWARAWTTDQPSAWIQGHRGVGKTFLARSILNQLLDKGVEVGELSAIEFNRIARRRFYEWHEQRKIYGYVEVLLIEDIDKAVWLPEGLSELFDLVDERYNNGRRTFVTSNKTIESVKDLWLSAVPENKSLPGTIQDRLMPIKRMEMKGVTHRKGEQSELREQTND